MWQVDNKTPFAHHAAPFRNHRGASFWSVWIAATFAMRQGRAPLFVLPQPPVLQAPVFVRGDPEATMLYDGEVTPPKDKIDLTLLGMAPPAMHRDGAVLLKMGDWQKRLKIRADRKDTGPVPLDGTAAEASDDLPTGRARDGNPKPRVTSDGHAALGPVPRHWPARAALAGTYDAAWQRNRAPLLPADLDPAFWQAAPADQQLDRPLENGLALEIGGLAGTGPANTPEPWPLPWLELRTDTRIAGAWQPAEAQLQSIAVDLDRGHVRLVYQSVWPIPSADNDVKIARTRIALRSGSGFRVTPADAKNFDRATSLREVAL